MSVPIFPPRDTSSVVTKPRHRDTTLWCSKQRGQSITCHRTGYNGSVLIVVHSAFFVLFVLLVCFCSFSCSLLMYIEVSTLLLYSTITHLLGNWSIFYHGSSAGIICINSTITPTYVHTFGRINHAKVVRAPVPVLVLWTQSMTRQSELFSRTQSSAGL